MNLAVKLMDTADSMFGNIWTKDPVTFTMKVPPESKSKSDDEVICDFINKILH